MDASVKKDINKLIEDSTNVIVSSVDEDGFPNVKKMYTIKNEGIKTFWFSTNVSAIRTQQWLKNPKSSIYFYNDAEVRGLMLIGEMQVCTDNETKQRFWKEGDEEYYPLGPTDPDYCMLKFTAVKGNYFFYGLKEIFHVDSI
jgi:pyridoxamine 5'-phosphate oxidase